MCAFFCLLSSSFCPVHSPLKLRMCAGKKDREICPVKKGYGMGVGGICVYEGVSLYSMVDRIRKALPCTLDESRTKLQAWQSKFHSIQNLLQTDRGPFFVREASTTTSVDLDVRHDCDGGGGMDDDGSLAERFIRLSGWSLDNNSPESSQVVDIAYSDAISATNCPSIQSACALIELAASAGALSLVVCCNQYRPGKEHILSMLHAYPLIDTALLMRGIQLPIDAVQLRFDETDNYVAFKAGFQVMLPAGMDAATAPKLSSQVAKKRDVGGDGDGDDDGDGDGGSGGEENPSGGDCQDDGDWPEEMQEPLILLSKEAFYCVKGERPLKTPDFMLVCFEVDFFVVTFSAADRHGLCVCVCVRVWHRWRATSSSSRPLARGRTTCASFTPSFRTASSCGQAMSTCASRK